MKKLVVIGVAILGFAASSFAQSINVTATVEIKKALILSKIGDLNFGTIYAPSVLGTLHLEPSTGVLTPLNGGTVTFQSGTSNAVQFSITGTPNTSVVVQFPTTDINLINPAFVSPIKLVLKSSITNGNAIITNGSGTATFYLGGDLTVGSNQPNGTYTNSNDLITVSVIY